MGMMSLLQIEAVEHLAFVARFRPMLHVARCPQRALIRVVSGYKGIFEPQLPQAAFTALPMCR